MKKSSTTEQIDNFEKAFHAYNSAVQKMSEGDDIGAAKLYQKAADYGLKEAQHNLGLIYLNGTTNIKPNLIKAAELFKQAVNQGCEESKYNLGYLMLRGAGTQQKPRNAYQCLSTANDTFSNEIKQQYKLGVLTFLEKSRNLLSEIGKDEKQLENFEALSDGEMFKLFLAYRELIKVKARTKNIQDLQTEFQAAENKLITIVPTLVNSLQTYSSNAQYCTKNLYVYATEIATDIQKYEHPPYKPLKNTLEQVRKQIWKQLTSEEKAQIKADLEKQKQAKAHIETDSQILREKFRIK